MRPAAMTTTSGDRRGVPNRRRRSNRCTMAATTTRARTRAPLVVELSRIVSCLDMCARRCWWPIVGWRLFTSTPSMIVFVGRLPISKMVMMRTRRSCVTTIVVVVVYKSARRRLAQAARRPSPSAAVTRARRQPSNESGDITLRAVARKLVSTRVVTLHSRCSRRWLCGGQSTARSCSHSTCASSSCWPASHNCATSRQDERLDQPIDRRRRVKTTLNRGTPPKAVATYRRRRRRARQGRREIARRKIDKFLASLTRHDARGRARRSSSSSSSSSDERHRCHASLCTRADRVVFVWLVRSKIFFIVESSSELV